MRLQHCYIVILSDISLLSGLQYYADKHDKPQVVYADDVSNETWLAVYPLIYFMQDTTQTANMYFSAMM